MASSSAMSAALGSKQQIYAELALTAITAHQQLELEGYLKLIPVRDLSLVISDLWLSLFLLRAYNDKNDTAMRSIISRWSEENPEEGLRPIIVSLFRMRTFSDDFYAYLVSLYPQLDFIDFMTGLNAFDHSDITRAAGLRIGRAFGPQTKNVYETAKKIIAKSTLTSINPFVESTIDDLSRQSIKGTAAKPSWIISHPDGKLHTNQDLLDTIDHSPAIAAADLRKMSLRELAKFALNQYKVHYPGDVSKYNVDNENFAVDEYVKVLEKSDLDEIIENLHAITETKYANVPHIFRVRGPSYPCNDVGLLNSNSRDPCQQDGGCRLDTCWENENEDDNGDAIIEDIVTGERYSELEWFMGICDGCGLYILQKHYALRLQMPTGGWKGCYCSFNCLRQEAKESGHAAIDELEKIYHEIGIYDRSWPEKSLMAKSEVVVPIPDIPYVANTTFDLDDVQDELNLLNIHESYVPITHITADGLYPVDVPVTSEEEINSDILLSAISKPFDPYAVDYDFPDF